jgi:hypothetical protein
MRLLRPLLLVSCLLVAASPAFAGVAQTIKVDGVNDFEPSNLVRDDRYDTQRFYCSPDSVFALDIGRAFVTNNSNYLFIGFDWPHKSGCYDNSPGPNLGIAIDVNTPAGGSTDPWGRKIGWANLTNKPDFVVYSVPRVPGNTVHWQMMYKWTGTAWGDSTKLVKGLNAGTDAVGMIENDSTGFVELAIPLSALGVATGATVNVEVWYTQDGGTKGPLDALMSSSVQMSHFPSTTTWDTSAVVQMTQMAPYTVLAFTDTVACKVSQAVATGFTLNAGKQFAVSTNRIDVTFDEPVSQATANVTGNYAFSGPDSRSVILASRDPSAHTVVHLVLNSAIQANAGFYGITVTNVQDLAGNTIVPNGTTNVGSFFIQNLVFQCDPGVALCKGVFTPADTFSVEGSLAPLTFDPLCDNALMYDGDANLVWGTTVPFVMPKNAVTGKAETDLEYKFGHQCSYEGGANRTYHLSSDNGASVTLTDYWNRENPADFTAQPVDVVFQVNAARVSPVPADTIYLQGAEYPLSFTPSGLVMKDDGLAPDLTAGDQIYTAKVRFPKCTRKNFEWKAFYRGAFECLGQGNRTVWLNDAAYDTVGGTLGALWLPARGIERCSRTDKPVTVVFKVSMPPATPLADTVAVMGSDSTLVWERPLGPDARMNDAGTGFDQVAGDHLWTTGVTFPDSTNLNVEFKFWHNGFLECFGMNNRTMTIDDVLYSTTTPQVRVPSLWDYCSDATADVPAGPATPDANAAFATLMQSFPNPMSPRTTIRFDLKRAGEASLTIYDVTGRRVATLLRGALQAGPHDVQWNGRDDNGNLLRSGVYLYELAMGKDRLSRRIALMR